MAKKKTKKKASRKKLPPLKAVSPKDFQMQWKPGCKACKFEHDSGRGGPSGCGVTDAIFVFTDGELLYVLAINYLENYACIEAFDEKRGVAAVCFADPKDTNKLFKKDLQNVSPKLICEALRKEIA